LEYLLEQAAAGVDFGRDEPRRQFLAKMLSVAAKIPDATARDQFADRIAHRARITEEVVRQEIRKAAVNRRTDVPREIPSAGQLKPAERGLIWGLFHRTSEALHALVELDNDDLAWLAGREVFEVARSLHGCSPDTLPSELLRRLSTMSAQLVTGIAGLDTSPVTDVKTDVMKNDAGLAACARSLKRLRSERERAALQREIDRLQSLGSLEHDKEIDLLLNQKSDLARQIEELT